MIELQGKYNTAKVFADNAESSAISQIMHLLNQEVISDSKIRIMPDVHAGMGSLLCVGKGNEDWNCSAPHGAGRVMSRSEAKGSITLSQYEKSMQGIYSSTVNRSTLDEAPSAYKPMEEIVAYIGDTVEILATVKPVFNFKAAE